MLFKSTRGGVEAISAAKAIIQGLSVDGGLFVPEKFPEIYNELKNNDYSYEELAYKIISQFFDDFTEEELKECIKNAYEGRFNVEVKNNFLELYHGPTCAFKDAALLFLPQIMKKSKEKLSIDKEIVILTATSGDTGKAALEGFHDVKGISVVVYYPEDGVSPVQKAQMVTQEGKNVSVVAIKGNFDDAQTGVKKIFSDEELKKELNKEGFILSSANSINIGRLVPQIVYYFYGYFELVKQGVIKEGESINVCVPTGNFGNILAAYYGKQMGLPIKKFICASNENNVLSDFFNTGVYDKRRELVVSESPSMDILVSSNLERLLFEICNRDPKKVSELMNSLNNEGIYSISKEMKENLKEFYGNYAMPEEVHESIRELYNEKGYVIDTHTAVGHAVWKKYVADTKDDTPCLIASTASAFKFSRSILEAMGVDVKEKSDFEILYLLNEKTGLEIPKGLKDLDKLEVLHNRTCDKNKMAEELKNILKLGE